MSRRPIVEYETINWKGKEMVPVDNGSTITLLPLSYARRQFRNNNVALISREEWYRLQNERPSVIDEAYR